jgi:hypothetical protein
MNASPTAPSSAEVADQLGSLSAGLGIITIQLFPFALPLLVLVIAPLALLAVPALLLAGLLALPLWLARLVRRGLSRRRGAGSAGIAAPAVGEASSSGDKTLHLPPRRVPAR